MSVSDHIGNMWKVEWENNEGGPDERLIREEHTYCDIIISQARKDPDASVTMIS